MSIPAQPIAVPQALAVAHADTLRVYRNLFRFYIRMSLEDDGWHVDYELKDPRWKGGGPHYVIDANTAGIAWKRYDR